MAEEDTPSPVHLAPTALECNGWNAAVALASGADAILTGATKHVPVAPALSKADIPVYIGCNGAIGAAMVVRVAVVQGAGVAVAAAVEGGVMPAPPLGGEALLTPESLVTRTREVAVHLPNPSADTTNYPVLKPCIPSPLPGGGSGVPGVPPNA